MCHIGTKTTHMIDRPSHGVLENGRCLEFTLRFAYVSDCVEAIKGHILA